MLKVKNGYQEKMGTVSLPPESVITRWEIWLQAALFYSKHLVERDLYFFFYHY